MAEMRLLWKNKNVHPTEKTFEKMGIWFSTHEAFTVDEKFGRELVAKFPNGFKVLDVPGYVQRGNKHK